MKRRTCDIQDGDERYIEKFEADLESLLGLVEEIFTVERQLLLSQVFREVIRDKGREVKIKFDKIKNKLCVDNLGKPLDQS